MKITLALLFAACLMGCGPSGQHTASTSTTKEQPKVSGTPGNGAAHVDCISGGRVWPARILSDGKGTIECRSEDASQKETTKAKSDCPPFEHHIQQYSTGSNSPNIVGCGNVVIVDGVRQ